MYQESDCQCVSDKAKNSESQNSGDQRDIDITSYFAKKDEIPNFWSYGEKTGKFFFNDSDINVLYKFIAEKKSAKKYAFIDVDTEYFKFHWDVDFKKERFDELNIPLNPKIIPFVLKKINMAMREAIPKELLGYVYADKSDSTPGLHLYYPDIVVNKHIANFLTERVVMLIKNDNRFDLPDELINKIIDSSVYGKGKGLRMLFQVRKNSFYKINQEKSTYKNIPKDKIGQLILTCIKTTNSKINFVPLVNIPNSPQIEKQKNVKNKNKKKIIDIKNKILKEKVSVVTIKKYLDLLDIKRVSKYDEWINIGIYIYNCNPTQEGFDLWDEWSKKAKNYGGKSLCYEKWNSFSLGNVGIGKIMNLAGQDNPEKYDELKSEVEKDKFDTVKMKREYIIDRKNKIKDKKNQITEYIDKWQTSKIKTLAIKSPYNTGKTTLIKSIFDEYKPQRVLFVSYRQSLSNELEGVFREYGFDNYMDGKYNSDRLICQVESLYKILGDIYYSTNGENLFHIPQYDLVILDEIESILNHFGSPTISNKEETYDLLHGIIYNSDKLLALDGDFGNRSYDYIKEFGENIIIHNTIKKNKNHYIFSDDIYKFDEQINDDVENNKNIVIITMSSNMGEKYYNKYKDKYKCILHSSKSDDEEKEKLKNVEDEWKKYQIVIYSPSVEAGVSFNINHFYRKYVILAPNSCSPRALTQMIARVRVTEDDTIHAYLNGLKCKESAFFHTFNEVKKYVYETCKKYIKPQKILDTHTNKYIIKYVPSLYTNTLIHNEQEKFNKKPHYFIPMFIKLLKDKGSTYTYDDTKTKKEKKVDFNKKDILEAKDITKDEYKLYMSKQKSNTSTKEEKCAIEKYLYKKNWGVDIIDAEFMDKYYRKTYVLNNLKYLLGNKEIDPFIEPETISIDKKLDFNRAKKNEQMKVIKELINKLGFSLEDLDKGRSIDRELFLENMEKIKEDKKLFKNYNGTRTLFKFDKSFDSLKSFMGFVNSVFKDWGIKIGLEKKVFKIKEDNKWKSKTLYYYMLLYLDNMNNFIK